MASSSIPVMIVPQFTQIDPTCSTRVELEKFNDGHWQYLTASESKAAQIEEKTIKIDDRRRELDGETWMLRLTIVNQAGT